MRKIDGVRDRVVIGGVHRDKFVALAHLDFAKNLEVFAGAALLADSGLLDQLDEGEGAAIEDGEFEVVELDCRIVDAHADEGREQVLGGGDQNALFHQAGGIADAGYVAAAGFKFEVIEVGAAEDYAGAGGSWD